MSDAMKIQQVSLHERLKNLRKMTVSSGLPIRRRDRDLYAILSGCLAICEDIALEGKEGELREIFRISVAGQGLSVDEARHGRRYANKSSDAFVLVCRYAMGETETAQLVSRYSQALREASRRQIRSEELADWLRENGGVLALYRSRPTVGVRSGGIRTIELDRTIECPHDGSAFTLTLKFNGKGFFNVVEVRA